MFWNLVNVVILARLIDALPLRFGCLLAGEAESLQYICSLLVQVNVTLIGNFVIFMLDLLNISLSLSWLIIQSSEKWKRWLLLMILLQ